MRAYQSAPRNLLPDAKIGAMKSLYSVAGHAADLVWHWKFEQTLSHLHVVSTSLLGPHAPTGVPPM